MNPTQSKIIDQVNENAIVNLASELIKIPSFKLEETPVANFLADFFNERGYNVDLQEVEPGRFQTIATLEGTGGGQSLMLNGHTDINSLTRRWTRDPWIPVVEGDHLYGHGIQNMKGGLTSIIMAAEAVRQSGVRLKGDLVIACVVGETQGGVGTHFLMETGFRTDMAVVAEPFGVGNLVTVHSGIVHMAIHTYGVTGHVRQLEGTVNAVVKMTQIINALQAVEFTYEPRADLPDLPKLNVGSVLGGLGEDYVLVEPPYIPDLCTIIVDVHFLPGQTVDGIVADIRRALDPPQGRRPRTVLRDIDTASRLLQGEPELGDGPAGCAPGLSDSQRCRPQPSSGDGRATPGHWDSSPLLLHCRRHLSSVECRHTLFVVRPGRDPGERRSGR